MSKELLLEIGTEEIPSLYLLPAVNKVEELAKKLFADNRISYGQLNVFVTPRRLILLVKDLADRQRGVASKVIGPPMKVSFDENGAPTNAAVGFAKNQGTSVKNLKIEKTEKGEYLCVVREEKGKETQMLIPGILTSLIFSIPFPKYMRWGDGEIKFVRPIQWILALYNGRIINLKLGNSIKGSNKSFGHRFLSPKAFTVKDFSSYEKEAKERFIIFNHNERKEMILKQASELAKKEGGTLYEDPVLLDIVSNLVEYPFSVAGDFESKYLELPKEILISVMKKHQRYFPIIGSSGGLLPKFIAVSNNMVNNPVVVKAGYERVLKARFSDAMFFYREDRRRHIQDYTEKLKSVVFQDKLGTYYEKVGRIIKLASYLSDKIDPSSKDIAERAAYLCKADLITQMVYEFPDLQGIMGREYARLSGEKPEVANAIYEHYLPRFAGDKLPESHAGAAVSIADKIDTIIGCFGVGLIPTGSEDPYSLRRQTLAIINIVLGKEYQVSIPELINKALEIMGQKIERDVRDIERDVMDFFKARFKNQLVSEGIPYDTADAILSIKFEDILDAARKVKALTEFKNLVYFEPLVIAFKRTANIIKEENYGIPDPSLFREDTEKELYGSFNNIRKDVEILLIEKRYLEAMKKIAEIRSSVDRFFDKVLVMVDDKPVRENRLRLLSEIAEMFTQIADFTKIVTVR
ncbi:MAG: glycine--tRNA ligase subunit beta [Nitrospinae bacterium RIFCSPLOWO2_02_FULL_39_110]|nr:MAG: glycine--tRNA ligase subunit beta [Nitrospinae bacterium RIFCSPLOWO2_02_FULL_39_110]OGW05542.1 MAG: glycine--tRNA ligase subunit beta [Nitrospinae bacterium RIFCSPLOWO2_02_39_17]OGW11010.1 MAG: glycine--tRNA ligase subunit beta [Nitrospinae bacterium RIFCSPLOWO2_12_39_15]